MIGGGDWSTNRIIPDCVVKWSKNEVLKIRSPESTRPWQHVLDVLMGYITFAYYLDRKNRYNGEIFNFGPSKSNNTKVIDLIKFLGKYWPKSSFEVKKIKN